MHVFGLGEPIKPALDSTTELRAQKTDTAPEVIASGTSKQHPEVSMKAMSGDGRSCNSSFGRPDSDGGTKWESSTASPQNPQRNQSGFAKSQYRHAG